MSATHGRLQGRTAIVTGAGAGVGRGIALALAEAGCAVILAVRRPSSGDETAALIAAEGGKSLVVSCDVTQECAVSNAISRGVEAFGGLDILVHNANASESALPLPLESITADNFSAQSRVTWDGAFWLARAGFAHLKRSSAGRFILLGSAFGLHGAAYNPVYAGLKAGLKGFTKSLAREWGPYGITVNAIAPAAATEPTEIFFKQHPLVRDAYLKNFPMRRMGRPREDIGGAVVALCLKESGYISAQNIQVDGGLFTAL